MMSPRKRTYLSRVVIVNVRPTKVDPNKPNLGKDTITSRTHWKRVFGEPATGRNLSTVR